MKQLMDYGELAKQKYLELLKDGRKFESKFYEFLKDEKHFEEDKLKEVQEKMKLNIGNSRC
jgi:hypothetical protein